MFTKLERRRKFKDSDQDGEEENASFAKRMVPPKGEKGKNKNYLIGGTLG